MRWMHREPLSLKENSERALLEKFKRDWEEAQKLPGPQSLSRDSITGGCP